MSLTMQIVMIILLAALPYGTAIICGALTERAGKTVSELVFDRRVGARHLFFFQEHGVVCDGALARQFAGSPHRIRAHYQACTEC